ncbi:unnamed protein product [Triticum turgidum subsp. durum]|uniref:PGG domain-containing protein n=1 Tax=Triticum turgidum subsp. durum TaxID=4567 RepID=A0A9R0YV93_TRITD|nr:unnamed protein product [Triticum turgidum subsp. durum]
MECGGISAVQVQPAAPMDQPGQPAKPPVQPWEYSLRKYLLLLAALVVTVTYAAGFSPPGGVWQTAHDGQPAGDPIIRGTHYRRYLAFFYCNATAFAASLVVIVLILILAVRHDKKGKDSRWVVVPLRLVMVLDLLSLMGAYGAGTCQDKVCIVYSAVLVAAVFLYIAVLKMMDWWGPDNKSGSGCDGTMSTAPNRNSNFDGVMSTPNPDSDPGTISSPVRDSDPNVREEEDRKREALKKLKADERLRKVLMLLATFAVSITYVAGLSTPGGFWDTTGISYRPGDAILKDRHRPRLTVFLLCNTTSFVASLLIIMLLIIDGKKLREKKARSLVLYGFIVVALVSLVGAYTAGSCRETKTTIYVVSLAGGILATAYILLYAFYTLKSSRSSPTQQIDAIQQTTDNVSARKGLDKARSLVLLLATLAATITYTAGLDPPGGVWQDKGDGYIAGDPILITTNIRRYRAFYYCNSVAFVASLVVIVLVQTERLIKHHVLEAAMILDLFGLIGAYAAGSCRGVNSSIYVMALAGAALIYVVIHIVFFTLELDHKDKKDDDEDELLEKRRKRLLLFAILAATITFQAGLTPPGGFLLQDDTLGHHAGDPILLHNYQDQPYEAMHYPFARRWACFV